jgi:hypothetical protein
MRNNIKDLASLLKIIGFVEDDKELEIYNKGEYVVYVKYFNSIRIINNIKNFDFLCNPSDAIIFLNKEFLHTIRKNKIHKLLSL